MNSDIKIMAELQRYWDNVLRGRNEIEKIEKSVSFWKKQTEEKKKNIVSLEEKTSGIKLTIRQKELDLAGKDDQLKKLEKRKDIVKNEKEMTALKHESDKVRADKDDLENELIGLFDSMEQTESLLAASGSEFLQAEKQSQADIKDLEERAERFRKSIDENRQKFDSLIDQLSPLIKPKFTKLINSHSGKAIAPIEGENCGACNFQIPFNLIQDALKEEKIVSCTNCGRFIYIEV